MFTKISIAHTFIDKNTTNRSQRPGIIFLEHLNTDVPLFQYLWN